MRFGSLSHAPAPSPRLVAEDGPEQLLRVNRRPGTKVMIKHASRENKTKGEYVDM
jgi:hypothetical protein